MTTVEPVVQHTCEQVARIRQLADTLDKVADEWPEHFHMGTYMSGLLSGLTVKQESAILEAGYSGERPDRCDTTACAVGWAPYALGIPKRQFEGWTRYATRVFGLEPCECGKHADHTATIDDWCCGYDYLFHNFNDPTTGTEGARAAAARLRTWADRHADDCIEDEL